MGRISKIEKARAALEQLRHEANKSVLGEGPHVLASP